MLSAVRRANLNGLYDIHTNQMHYPVIMQPTHTRIEQIADGEDSPDQPAAAPPSTIFPAVKPSISRNFLIMDTHLETPPAGVAAAAYDVPFRTSRPDHEPSAAADFLSPFRGLRAVPDDIRDLLPDECRQAFDGAKDKEDGWFARWGDEAQVTSRREPVVDKAIVPYSMMIA
jgi:chromatin structure-remodeling complex protein RSC7